MSSKNTSADLFPILATVALTSFMAVFFARDLGVEELQHTDSYRTMTRSLGFLLTGDWTTVHQCGSASFKKPPLQYMLTAGLLATDMNPSLSLRIWPYIFTVGTVALTGLLAAFVARSSRGWAALCAVALLSSSSTFWTYGRMGLLDAGQSFFLVAALCGAMLAVRNPRYWLLAAFAVGLGFLQKTPAALGAAFIFILTQSYWEPDGPLAWKTNRRESIFWVAVWIAVALCLVWPAIQVAGHGSDFLDQFFLRQMYDRFAPNNPVEADATIASFRWIPKGEAVLTAFCLAATVAVFVMPRFRTMVPLRGVAVLVAITAVALTFAGGQISPRYILSLLPLLVTVGACVLVALLPRPTYAAMVSLAVLALSLPSLATIWDNTKSFAPSDLIDIIQRYKELGLDNGSPVFVLSPRDHDHNGFTLAFCYHGKLSQLVRVRHSQLDDLERSASRIGLAPPFSGIVRSEYFTDVERVLGPVVKVAREGSYLIWRQTAPQER